MSRFANAAILMVVAGSLTAWAYFYFSPAHPHSWLGWLALIVAGIPVMLLIEGGNDLMPGRYKPDSRAASVLVRIAVAVAICTVTFGLYMIAAKLIGL